MDVVGVVARVVVGLVLVVAGGAKLRTRAWGLLAIESGTPRSVVIVLPAVEVVLGAGLVFQLGRPLLAWASVMLFGAFVAFVSQRYRSGSDAGCNCFGISKNQEPVSLLTMARNAGLLATALLGALF